MSRNVITSLRKGQENQIANMQEKTLLNGLSKTAFAFIQRQ